MIIKRLTFVLASLMMLHANAQILVGLHKSEVVKLMDEKMPEFGEDDMITKKSFNYLKYIDNNNDTRTFIVFSNDNDTCKFTKLMYDY